MFPARYTNLAAARERFGAHRVESLGQFLWRPDPLADDVIQSFQEIGYKRGQALVDRALQEGIKHAPEAPTALRRLFEAVDYIPFWVDFDFMNKGGAAFLRTGFFGGLVLACESLVMGYCSPAGNKPLTFTGRLREQAPRRLNETSQFVLEVCKKDGLRRASPGFGIALKVRLMHAQVRYMLSHSERWRAEEWGTPINQHDMLGTLLLFSVVALDGVRKFGFRFTSEESEGLMHLWRYAGYLLGVEPELLPTSEKEGLEIGELLRDTARPPDEDSRALTSALLEAARTDPKIPKERASHIISFGYGVSYSLIGPEYAKMLDIPKTTWRFAVPLMRRVIERAERVREALPNTYLKATERGTRYWEWVVQNGLAGIPAQFELPEVLSPLAMR